MCRLLAYSGPPVAPARYVLDAQHSLLVQSYAPREMTAGTLNADGFGMAWYAPAKRAEPYRYRTTAALWNDQSLPDIAAYVASGHWLAYARSATPGQALDLANTQPFTDGPVAFIHNGFIRNFRPAGGGGLHRRLRSALDDHAYASIHGSTDSEHLFAFIGQHIRGAEGDIVAGTAAALSALAGLAGGTDELRIGLNLIISDPGGFVAVRHSIGGPPASLYRLTGNSAAPGAVLVASEPLFDSADWRPVDPGTMLVVKHFDGRATWETTDLAGV